METKVCAHCGSERSIDQYRKYYNRPGLYAYCKTCEKIETRRKYLSRKEGRTEMEEVELDKISSLYDLQRQHGLRQATKAYVSAVLDLVDQEVKKYDT